MRSRFTHRASTRKNIIETTLRERTRISERWLSEPGTSLFALLVDLHGEARSRHQPLVTPCVLNECGERVWEQKISTTAKALQAAFGGMPRSRIALETGMHSPFQITPALIRTNSWNGQRWTSYGFSQLRE